ALAPPELAELARRLGPALGSPAVSRRLAEQLGPQGLQAVVRGLAAARAPEPLAPEVELVRQHPPADVFAALLREAPAAAPRAGARPPRRRPAPRRASRCGRVCCGASRARRRLSRDSWPRPRSMRPTSPDPWMFLAPIARPSVPATTSPRWRPKGPRSACCPS